MSDRSLTATSRWFVPLCLLSVVAIFALCMVIGSRHTEAGEGGFSGTDDAAAEAAEQAGAQPWFHPIFEPGSSEVESGLFALQAALGAGIVGFALGRLSGKKEATDELAAAQLPPNPMPPTPVVASERGAGDVGSGARG